MKHAGATGVGRATYVCGEQPSGPANTTDAALATVVHKRKTTYDSVVSGPHPQVIGTGTACFDHEIGWLRTGSYEERLEVELEDAGLTVKLHQRARLTLVNRRPPLGREPSATEGWPRH